MEANDAPVMVERAEWEARPAWTAQKTKKAGKGGPKLEIQPSTHSVRSGAGEGPQFRVLDAAPRTICKSPLG